MAKIKKIIAREILDSRAHPTVEVIVELADSQVGIFSTPSGASTGKNDAVELRDQDPNRYHGLGVLRCLENIAKILAPKLIGMEAQDQDNIDQTMINLDGSKNKSKLGANSILALSGAIAKAQAASEKVPIYQYIAQKAGENSKEFSIPTPMFNVLNGGAHANFNLDFQEFLIVPTKANSYSRNLKIGVECYFSLYDTLKAHSASVLIGDEGGFAPSLYTNMDALKMLEEATTRANLRVGLDLFFSIDVASSQFMKGDLYRIKDKPVPLPPVDLIDFYILLNEQYHLLSLEDPIAENDWDNWKTVTQKLGVQTLIVGDDLISTNLERLKKAISEKACNAVIIKPNQVGTISEAIKVAQEAKNAGFRVIVSNRSGETNDDFIADFAVGIGADYVKFGAPARGERVAKYNRLLEIEHDLS